MGFKQLVSCAACIFDVTIDGSTKELIIADVCHHGRNMQAVYKLLCELGAEIKPSTKYEDRGQGFLDQNGSYLTRSEAYVIAKNSGQLFNDKYTLPNNKLDSSCIRHIKEV